MTARENAETADLTLEVERLQYRIAELEAPGLDCCARAVSGAVNSHLHRIGHLEAEAERLRGELNAADAAAFAAMAESTKLEQRLAESEKKCQALAVENDGWARQLAAAQRVAKAAEEHLEHHRIEDPHALSEVRHELWQRDSECKALSQDRHELRKQLAEATGLLSSWRHGGRPVEGTEAFLSRAPAQAAEPVDHAPCLVMGQQLLDRAESAESKLAAVLAMLPEYGDYGLAYRIRALLAPSQGQTEYAWALRGKTVELVKTPKGEEGSGNG